MKRRKGRAALVASAVMVALAGLLTLAGCAGETPVPKTTGVSVSRTPAVVDGYVDLGTLSVAVARDNTPGETVQYTSAPSRFSFTVDGEPVVPLEGTGRLVVGFGEHTVGLTYTESFGSAATSFNVESSLTIPQMDVAEDPTNTWQVTVSHATVYKAEDLEMKMYYTVNDGNGEKKYTIPFTVTYVSEPVTVTARATLEDGSGAEVVVSEVSTPLVLAPTLSTPTVLTEKNNGEQGWNVTINYAGNENPTLEYQVVTNTSNVPTEPIESGWEIFNKSLFVEDTKTPWGWSVYARATKDGYSNSSFGQAILLHQLNVKAGSIVTISDAEPGYAWKVTFTGEADNITQGAKITYKYGESYGGATGSTLVYSGSVTDVQISYDGEKSMKLWFDVEKDGYEKYSTPEAAGIALPSLVSDGVSMTIDKETDPYDWTLTLTTDTNGSLKYRYTEGKPDTTWTAYDQAFSIGGDIVGNVTLEAVAVDDSTGAVLGYATQQYEKIPVMPQISVYNTGTEVLYSTGMPDFVFTKDPQESYPEGSQFQWRTSMDDGASWTDWSDPVDFDGGENIVNWKSSNIVKVEARTVMSDGTLLPSDPALETCTPEYMLGDEGPGGGMVVMMKDRGSYVQRGGAALTIVEEFTLTREDIRDYWMMFDLDELAVKFNVGAINQNGWGMRVGTGTEFAGMYGTGAGTDEDPLRWTVGIGLKKDAIYWGGGYHPDGENSYTYMF